MTSNGPVLVIGATGNQGSAVARALLARGRRVHALVRDPGSVAARRLEGEGADLVQGDLEDVDSLRRAMSVVMGVFSVQPMSEPPETEVRQGVAVAHAARDAGVGHLVYSSVGGAERHTGIEHFETKARVEEEIARLGLPATVLRPVFFMENLLGFLDVPEGEERVLSVPVPADTPMQLIAAADIGWCAAAAFQDPDRYRGHSLEIAGDELTFPEVAAVFERVTGTPTRFHALPAEDRMTEWFATEGYQADIPALRSRHPNLLTFEDFLSRQLVPHPV